MPSWAARCNVVAECRADRMPTLRPTRCAQTSAMPSRIKKRLLSEPSPYMTTAPSVRTPSTSSRISLMLEALPLSSGFQVPASRFKVRVLVRSVSSKHLGAPEIVQVYDAGHMVRRSVDHDNRGDV